MSASDFTVKIRGIVLIFVLGLAGSGCGSRTSPSTPPTELSLRKLATYYGMYVSAHKGQSPASEAVLKKFIAEKAADINQDDLFLSHRDREPYVVRYQVKLGGGNPVIAHEKTGHGGKKFVAFSTTEVRELDAAEFDAAVKK